MDEDYSESDESEVSSDDDDDDDDDSDDDDDDDESEEVELAEYNDNYDLSEERVGEPIDDHLVDDSDSSESTDYFLMTHTLPESDSEEAVGSSSDELGTGVFGTFYSEEAVGDSEKPLSVGDSFFDINDDELVQDLASKFGLEDDDKKVEEASDEVDLTAADAGMDQPLRKKHDHEVMIGVSATKLGLGKSVAFWSNSSFYMAVAVCSIVLFGVFAYLIIQWQQDKGDDLEDFFEAMEG